MIFLISFSLILSLFVKGAVIAVFIYYGVRYFSPKNEANNWISAVIIGFSLSFLIGILRLIVGDLFIESATQGIGVYYVFRYIYKQGRFVSIIMYFIIWIILVIAPLSMFENISIQWV